MDCKESCESPVTRPINVVPQQHQMSINDPGDFFMEIDAEFTGFVIGRNGQIVKRLSKRTGAFIWIFDSATHGYKTVKISGTQKAKKYAYKLINDIIDWNHPDKVRKRTQEARGESSPLKLTLEIKEESEKGETAALPPIVKDYYKEHPEVTMMTDQEVEDFRKSKNNIMIKYISGNNVKSIPKPVLTFSHAFQDYPDILQEIQKQKFETPSPVQCQAWPVIMSGHDLIAIAQTGTGKTLAFLLPAFIHIDIQSTPRSERKGPSVLVLAPTREIVFQIENEVKKYSYKGIKAMSIYGGVRFEEQIEILKKGVEIVIATPGRLNDFIRRGVIDLSNVSFLILDEADRMLNMGFEPQIRVSLLSVRPDRQTIMTSATWPPGVERLAKNYTTNPIQFMVGSLDLTAVNTVKQDILIMDDEEKKGPWIDNFLKSCSADDKIIIFVKHKITAAHHLLAYLMINMHKVESIHGDRESSEREMILKNFRNGEVNILITTDMAFRGIDINDITVVINFDFVKDIEEYVYRVGLTGRAGKTGLAITLMTKMDCSKAKGLVELMEKSGQDVPPELRKMASKYEAKEERDRAERGDRPSDRGFSVGYGGFSWNKSYYY